jgi:hypothetical protein
MTDRQTQANTFVELTDAQLDAVIGGAVQAQIFQTLSSAVSEVMKNFGGALQTAARGG